MCWMLFPPSYTRPHFPTKLIPWNESTDVARNATLTKAKRAFSSCKDESFVLKWFPSLCDCDGLFSYSSNATHEFLTTKDPFVKRSLLITALKWTYEDVPEIPEPDDPLFFVVERLPSFLWALAEVGEDLIGKENCVYSFLCINEPHVCDDDETLLRHAEEFSSYDYPLHVRLYAAAIFSTNLSWKTKHRIVCNVRAKRFPVRRNRSSKRYNKKTIRPTEGTAREIDVFGSLLFGMFQCLERNESYVYPSTVSFSSFEPDDLELYSVVPEDRTISPERFWYQANTYSI